MIQLLHHLWNHINLRRRYQFVLLLVLMIFTSFAEVLSIGAVIPFLTVITDPNIAFSNPIARPIIEVLHLTEPNQLLIPLTIAFGTAAIIAGGMRLLLLWATTRLSYAAGADLSINIYRRTLFQSYAVHCARNSSEIIDAISNKTNNAIYQINMTLNLISSSVILISIIFAIVSIDPFVAFATLSGFGLIYVVIIFFTKDRLLKNSLIVARESTFVIKSLQEGLGGIRDVLIDGSQEEYCKIYSRADQPMRRAQGNSVFISSGPKYVLEALGMLTLAFIAFALSNQSDGFANIIPIIGAFALGAQRLLPVLQQAYGSYSSIKGGQASLQDTLKLLDQPNPIWLDQSVVIPLSFRQQIELDKVSFRYSHETPWVLKDVSLTISKGSTVGFIGTTGSGKSTLLDLVMGLLTSTKGLILIDGQPLTLANQRTWQNRIAHVPQSIFLADSSVAENIAFGVPKDQIDYAHVKHVAHLAKISKSIMTWPEQYETIVGERGVRLSGGQRQRIGIARALYKQAEVIIFDEATSALDNQTEQAVMQSIGSLGKELTIMIIAHRLTTLHNCSQIVELNGGEVIRTGSYRDFVSKLNNNNSYEIHTHK